MMASLPRGNPGRAFKYLSLLTGDFKALVLVFYQITQLIIMITVVLISPLENCDARS